MNRAVLSMNDFPIEVGGLHLRQESQNLLAQPARIPSASARGVSPASPLRLRHGIVGGQVLPSQEGPHANGKNIPLGITQMT